jgi:hypothetical protein
MATATTPVMSGYLGVQYPGLLKTLKKRWCLLAGTSLAWFKAPQSIPCDPTQASHFLDLSTLKTVALDGRVDGDGPVSPRK